MQRLESDRPKNWGVIIGFVLEKAAASRIVGYSEEELIAGNRERGLISCTTKDGVIVFPGFQFEKKEGSEKPTVVEGFSDVISVFIGSEISDWTLAGWMVMPQEELEGESVIEYLKTGKGTEKPLALAHNLAGNIANPPVA